MNLSTLCHGFPALFGGIESVGVADDLQRIRSKGPGEYLLSGTGREPLEALPAAVRHTMQTDYSMVHTIGELGGSTKHVGMTVPRHQ